MRLQLNQFFALAGLTALETVRQPITLILVASCIVFIGVLPVLLTHTLGESARLVRDSAFALHFVCGLILGGYAACSSLTHEIRRGTAAAVLSKPVGRHTFFIAKYGGIACVLVLFSLYVTLATLLSVRMVHEAYTIDQWAGGAMLLALLAAFAIGGLLNYTLRKPFCSTTFFCMGILLVAAFVGVNLLDDHGNRVAFGGLVDWNLIPVSGLVSMGILVLAAIAVSLATRFEVLATLAACTAIFLLGLMSDYLFGETAATSGIVRILYALVPNWQHFWVVDALSSDTPIPGHYLLTAAGYGLFYLAGVLCLGLLAFRKMEVNA
jgi:ABC-type transport system involved in multi-copper enzyme maturation permease subunit